MTTHNPLAVLSDALAALAASAASSVVSVRSHHSRSTGFLWRPGLIVTSDEALAEEGEVTVGFAGAEPVAAKIAGRDPTTDIALLRVETSGLTPAKLASPKLAVGALALVAGVDEDGPTAALGVVSRASGPWRSMRGGDIASRLELAVPLGRRAEGGVVLDAAGQAFGMAVFGPRRRVLVIPSATIERVAARLETHGRIARGYLGLGLQPVSVEGAEGSGVMVMSVDPKGPGVAAGVHQGDVIVSWNDEPIRHFHALLQALGPDSVGRTVALGLRRGGENRQISLTIAERPNA